MNRQHHRWFSRTLERDMDLLVFGHAGTKILVFPTRDGRFYEYEDLGLVHVLAPRIRAGQIQLFCVDSIAQESLYCQWRHPADRIRMQKRYEQYVLDDVLPFMHSLNPHSLQVVHGCSLGAFQATNLAFRHPHLFQKLSAFSGRYDLTLQVEHFRNLFDGYYDDEIYFNQPSHFLPGLSCDQQLTQLRNMDMVFTIGWEDPFRQNNEEFSHQLWQKNIPHSLIHWDGRAHSGSYWRRMVALYL